MSLATDITVARIAIGEVKIVPVRSSGRMRSGLRQVLKLNAGIDACSEERNSAARWSRRTVLSTIIIIRGSTLPALLATGAWRSRTGNDRGRTARQEAR